MSLLRYYNLTKGAASFPGVTGTLASGEARSVVVDTTYLDAELEALALRGPLMGLAYLVPGGEDPLPATAGGTQRFAAVVSSSALPATARCAVLLVDSLTPTLMAASAVPANTVVRVLLDHAGSGLTAGSVARAGSDTINGAATPISLTASAPLITLRSDGVSAWVTL